MCGQLEETKTEKLHIQAYVQFKNRKRFTGVVKIFPSGKWRVKISRGTAEENRTYTKKEDSSKGEWREWGLCTHARKSCELAQIKEDILEGSTVKALWENYWPTMVRNSRGVYLGMKVLRAVEAKSEYELKDFEWPEITDWTKSHVLWGKTGIGKTEFALAHFKQPWLISHIDQLGAIDWANCDGLVFDDMNFVGNYEGKGAWPQHSQIHLVDQDQARAINIKHSIALIPKGTKKIFTTNAPGGLCIDIEHPPVLRRICIRELKLADR